MQRVACLILSLSLAACSGDDENVPAADAPPMTADGPITPDGPTVDAGPTAQQQRGRYLVDHVALCGDCHTPRNLDGSPDLANYLAGASCFIDVDPATSGVGCLSSRNLTNGAAGLMNRTDQEIKDMFQGGTRPNDAHLFSVMPYWLFANLTTEDADAIVAYLRTVPANANAPAANEAP